MLVGIMMGQRTPGVTIAQAREFEERINQRYVDHLVGAGWGYYGVYQVDGLVPGAFGEILTAEGDDLDDALRRDKENDADLPDDIAAFYRECRGLFWTRGGIGTIWQVMDEIPPRNVSVRVVIGDGTFEIEPTDALPEAPVDAVHEDDPRMPESIAPGTVVTFHPFVMAPLPS
jgi:hypothetical protein